MTAFFFWLSVMTGGDCQPASEWNASINFNANAPNTEDAWAFDAVQVADGRIVVCGYVRVNDMPDDTEGRRRPGYAILDADGRLLETKYFNEIGPFAGVFAKAKKLDAGINPARDGVLLFGRQDNAAPNAEREVILVKLDTDLKFEWVRRFSPIAGASRTNGDGLDAWWSTGNPNDPNDDEYQVAMTGVATFANGISQGFSVVYKFGTDGTPTLVMASPPIPDDGELRDCLLSPETNPTEVIFVGRHNKPPMLLTATSTNADNTIPLLPDPFTYTDRDMIVGRMSIATGVLTTKIFDDSDFPASACPGVYGPCSPGKSMSAWGFCESGSQAVDDLGASALRNEGKSILRIGNSIFTLAHANSLEITAGYSLNDWQHNGPGVELNDACLDGKGHHYHDYLDADIWLFKFNANNLNTPIDKQYIGHFSGGDFAACMVEDKLNGGIVIAGTTADRGICGLGGAGPLPDVDLEGGVAEANFLMKVDPVSLDPIWQEHFAGQGEGNCAFGLVQGNDGGFFVIGNNELEGENETFNVIKFGADDCVLPPNCAKDIDLYASGNGTAKNLWNSSSAFTPTHVTGVVRIHDQAILTIEDVAIEFGLGKLMVTTKFPDAISGIVVEPGGHLIVKNATLKGMCGRMWDGISAQSELSGKISAVAITNNSFILDAARGAVAGEFSYSIQETPITLPNGATGIAAQPVLHDGGLGGASIYVSGSTFRNCGKHLVWHKPVPTFLGFGLKTVISNSVFECTSSLADPLYFNTFGIGQPLGTEVFCEANAMKSIYFNNCEIRNTANFGHQRHNGVGVYGFQTRFLVNGDGVKNNFQNLFIGLEAAGGPSGVANHVTAKQVRFNGCYQGMNLRSTLGSSIFDCDFVNIPPADSQNPFGPLASGLFCESSQGVKCAENLFQSNFPNLVQSGAVFVNSLSGAEVYRNTFDNIAGFPTGFAGDNLALSARCNTYEEPGTTQMGEYAWLVSGQLANQGTGLTIDHIQPDNRFWSNCLPTGDFDIYNAGQSFIYYEKHPSVLGVVECVANVNMSFSTDQTYTLRNCPFKQFLIGEDGGLLTEYQNSGNGLPERNRLLNAYLATDPETGNNPESGPDNAINLLVNRNKETDKRLLSEAYLGREDYANAQTRYMEITGSDEPTQHLKTVLNSLIGAGNAGRNVFSLNSSDWNSIAGLLTSEDLGGSWARNLDFIRNRVYHPLTMAMPVNEYNSKLSAAANSDASAFPNPFSQSVKFKSETGIKEVIVHDLTGRQIWISAGEDASRTWTPTAQIPDGLYHFTIRTLSDTQLKGTLVFIRQ